MAGQIRRFRAAWGLSAAGAVLLAIHIGIAMGEVHGWSHAAAVRATADQTRAIFGLDWGGGVFVNYGFLTVWVGELTAWRLAVRRGVVASNNVGMPRAVVWPLRAFYLIVIVSAAVVFAAGWRRWLGAAVVLALLAAWTQPSLAGEARDGGALADDQVGPEHDRHRPRLG